MNSFSRASLIVAGLLASAAAWAADIDGKWVGKIGESDITFTLKAEGEKLTGTLDNAAQAGVIEIKDGRIGKDGAVSFNVVRNLNNAETKIEWTGKLAGDELKLTRAAVGQNAAAEVVAKRTK
jgi:soluble P-type ATPase